MEAESFFARWAQRNAEAAERRAADAAQPGNPEVPALEDVAQLTPDSDFAPFLARGVDENVRRSALKKLFADPHFNAMDGLDVYIEDYSRFEPIPAAMLAALDHAQALLHPQGENAFDAVEPETRETPPASDADEGADPPPSQELPPHDDPL